MALKITDKHWKFITRAGMRAQFAQGIQRHGCLLVKGGRIVGMGQNSYLHGVHAEESAIGSLMWYNELKGAEAYICRLRKTQLFGNSRPCARCMQLFKEMGIRKIIYTTNDAENPIAIEKI